MSGLIGSSAAMCRVRERLDLAATSRRNLLLRGEPGTGKRLAASFVHQQSAPQAPFVAFPTGVGETMVLDADRLVVRTFGGTLLVDDLADLAPEAQRELEVLLEQLERRRGGPPFRVIAVTRRDIETRIRRGVFDERLLALLNAETLWLPPLRARLGDVEPLALHFIDVVSARANRVRPVLTESALRLLAAQRWPGNVCQLEEVMSRLVARSPPTITSADIAQCLDQMVVSTREPEPTLRTPY